MAATIEPRYNGRVPGVAAAILFAIAALESIPLWFSLPGVSRALRHPQTPTDVVAAALVAAAFVAYSLRQPGIRRHVFDRSWLRVPAVLLAIVAGTVEEAYFRHVLMDSLADRGAGIVAQVAASALVFGAAHAIWGTFGGARVMLGAMTATTLLGLALAVMYATNGRVVVPCIEAHVAIDLVLEPALVLFAVESGFARRRARSAARALAARSS